MIIVRRLPDTSCQELCPKYPVRLRVSPALLPYLSNYLAGRSRGITVQGEPDAAGWATVDLVFEYEWEARSFVLGWGRAAEVIEPQALRLSVIDYAGQILAFYQAVAQL
jgi:hypothetical protein